MSFPPEFLDQLRARVSLSDIVGRRVSFDRRKSNPRKRDYWGCCPFHGEKTPSFHVDDVKGFYHCFGCGASGDAFTFLQQAESLSFREAVERLAGEAGLPLPARDPRQEARQQTARSLRDVLEVAQRYFLQTLAGRDGESARRYLEARGCGPEAWHAFGLGLAPGRGGLFAHLRDEGIPQALMAEAGLVVTEGERAPYDWFRERIVFPIRDGRDLLVGFGGRTLRRDSDTPKYINSPETVLFNKGRLLFNFGPARRALRDGAALLIVEGYMDVIALHGAGFSTAVAPLGTALTEEQLALAWRVSPEPILCFDGDAAGRRAANRAADLALPLVKPGLSLRVALLPEGQDPDDLIRRQGVEAMRQVLASALPLDEILWQRERDAAPLDTPERRADLEQRLNVAIRRIGDTSVRGYYERAMRERVRALFFPGAASGARRSTASERSSWRNGTYGAWPHAGSRPRISEALRRNPLAQAARRAATRAQGAGLHALALHAPTLPALEDTEGFLTDIEAMLVLMIVDRPEILDSVAERLGHAEFTSPKLDKLCKELIHLASSGPRLDGAALKDHLRGCGVLDAVEGMAAREMVRRMRSAWTDVPASEVERAWSALDERQERVRRLRAEIEEAEAALGDEPGADAHWQRLKALMAERQILERSALWPSDTESGTATDDER